MIPKEIETFLRKQTTGIKHSGRTFYEHLKGTHDLLEQDGEHGHVCLAGLFHSIYGTNAFKVQTMTLDSRMDVIKLIGKPAERLAYIFCACDRPLALLIEAARGQPYSVHDRFTGHTIALTRGDLEDLLTIERANLKEQGSIRLLPDIEHALSGGL